MNNVNRVLISGNLYYQFDSVAFFIVTYHKFKIKIWDNFIDFVDNIDELTLKISGYDPMYVQPTVKSFKIKVNIPP